MLIEQQCFVHQKKSLSMNPFHVGTVMEDNGSIMIFLTMLPWIGSQKMAVRFRMRVAVLVVRYFTSSWLLVRTSTELKKFLDPNNQELLHGTLFLYKNLFTLGWLFTNSSVCADSERLRNNC